MPTSDKKLKRVVETRMRDGVFMGLVEYEDGTREWKPPSSVDVEGTITRADGTVDKAEISDVKLSSVSCGFGVVPCE